MSDSQQQHRRYPQLTLGTLLLAVTAVAIFMAWHRTRNQISAVQPRVEALKLLARELQIDDPANISVVSRLPTLAGEVILDFYVPPSQPKKPSHQLCLALEGILGHGYVAPGFPPADRCIVVPSGVHSVEVRHKDADDKDPNGQHEIVVLLDNEVVFHVMRPANWHPSDGWTSTGSYPISQSFPPDEPVELLRRRFNERIGSGGSRSADVNKHANGILLWLQPMGDEAE